MTDKDKTTENEEHDLDIEESTDSLPQKGYANSNAGKREAAAWRLKDAMDNDNIDRSRELLSEILEIVGDDMSLEDKPEPSAEERLEAIGNARSTILFAVNQIEALSQCGISLVSDWDMYRRDHEDAANILELLLHSIKGLTEPLNEPFEALSLYEEPFKKTPEAKDTPINQD